ncbi:glycoside hydrolase family 13 protein, partial [Piromyces sp. E2]
MVYSRAKVVEIFRGSKIYQVFIDRFAGCLDEEQYSIRNIKRDFLGGNITDLIKKIDYIKSMDYTVIWLTPFYVNQPHGNHGYHVINYNHVDPRFAFGNLDRSEGEKNNQRDGKKEIRKKREDIGNPFDDNDVNVETEADKVLKTFIQECHKKGIKVMMDFVPNHCHEQHPFFQKAKEDPQSEYREWFYFNGGEGPTQTYLQFLHVGELPKLNLSHSAVHDHLVNSTKKFLSYGIDAVRVDHCIGPRQKDLASIINEIHESYPDVPFIGEILPFGCQHAPETIFGLENEDLQKFKEETVSAIDQLDDIFLKYYDILDGVLDFTFQYYVDKFVSGTFSKEKCTEKLIQHFNRYKEDDKKEFLLLKNVDSHDCDRIMFRCHNNIHILHQALIFLYQDDGERNDPIVVYYGTEDLMSQDDTIRRGDY